MDEEYNQLMLERQQQLEEALDKAESQAAVNSAAVAMIEKVRQRLTKVRRDTTYRDAAVTPDADDSDKPLF